MVVPTPEPGPSITSSESFAARAQRSEQARATIWAVVLAGMLLLTLARRWAGGVVMTDNHVFLPYSLVLLAALVWQVVLVRVLRRASLAVRLLPNWLWPATVALDLGVAAALLVIGGFLSPRGAVPALSSPPMLLLPLAVLLSVLRLRPNFTLCAGLAAALFHAALAARAGIVSGAPASAYPVYLAYGFVLVLTAVAGRVVAREVRRHVREAAEEAVAHERAERQVGAMRHDLSVARQIQLGLLPTRAPDLAGFDVAGMNRPADQTGGDYYDWQRLPDGRLAVALADVAGHGIGPAIVMAVCRAYARAAAPAAADPAALLGRLNRLLHEDLPSDRFITFVLAVLDESGAAKLISAGHGPTLLYRAAGGEITQFGGDGIPLGIYPSEEYGPTTDLLLDEGDLLVMLTDGFFEGARPGDGEAFGIDRLQAALRAAASAPSADARTILHGLDRAAAQFCDGSPQADDMTAIVIRRTAPAAAPLRAATPPAAVG